MSLAAANRELPFAAIMQLKATGSAASPAAVSPNISYPD